jgi:hypothetical protein
MLFMYAGAVLGLVNGIVNGLTTHNISFYTYDSTANSTTVHSASSIVAGLIGGIIYAGLWLWMAWKTGTGRNWARVLSSVFFGFMCLFFIGGIVGLSTGAVADFIVLLVQWGIALAALVYLWKRESGQFFALAKQAKLAARYGAPPVGYQPPGYGQPGYGQPGYGQAPPYGQDSPPPPQNG